MYRFFVPPEVLSTEPVVLGPDLAHRLGRVLRLRPGDRVVLLDNTGWEYQGEIVRLARDRVEVRLASRAPARGALAVGLGPRILRAETAGLVAAAAILFHRGELGG